MLISLTQWAADNGYTDAAARNLIKRKKLPQAQKIGRNWIIDDAAKWPTDNRYKNRQNTSPQS